MSYRTLAFGAVCVSIGALGLGTPARAATPTLCLVVEQGTPIIGLPTEFRIELGEGDTEILAGQFKVFYDPQALAVSSVQPGFSCDATSPFSLLSALVVDESAGIIEFDVTVPLFESGTKGPAVMACLNLIPIGSAATTVCLVNEPSGATILIDNLFNTITPLSGPNCPAEAPAIACGEVPDPSPNECAEMDSDGDGDIDLDDFAAFQRCLSAPVQRVITKSAP